MILQILSCAHCGRRVVSVGPNERTGTRINDHKCAGLWDVVDTVSLTDKEASRLVQEVRLLITVNEA